MKNVFKSYSMYVFLLISLSSCAQDDNPSNDLVGVYKSCCGADPADISVGAKERLFIPNSFTPNSDGINDFFVPSYTGDIRNMQTMTIYSLERDTILYILRGGDVDNFEKGKFGWDGTRTGVEPLYAGDWKIHKGGFRYEISIWTADQGYVNFNGKACAIQCGAEAAGFKDNKACFFPSQVNTEGVFDSKALSGESDCFK